MNFYYSLSNFTRKLIITTIGFLFYGYLCRLLSIYFLWESKTIGWILFWIAAIFILRDRIKLNKLQGKFTILQKFLIGISVFIILLKGATYFFVYQGGVYDNAINFIKSNPEIQRNLGPVKSIILVPTGWMSLSTGSKGTAGQADLYFTVKGSKKYADLNLIMGKDFNTDWQILIAK